MGNVGIEWNVAMQGNNGDKFLVTRNHLVMNINGTLIEFTKKSREM